MLLTSKMRRVALHAIYLISLISTSAITLPAAEAQSFIENPGFEINGGDYSTIAPPWDFIGSAHVANDPGSAHSGHAFVRLYYRADDNSRIYIGNVAQTVAVDKTGYYELSFYYASHGNINLSYFVKVDSETYKSVDFTGNKPYRRYADDVYLYAGVQYSISLVANLSDVTSGAGAANVDDFNLTLMRRPGRHRVPTTSRPKRHTAF